MCCVSVILPVYNASDYLYQCLDSIVNQTLKEIEIIAINDGSTDNSLEILQEYSKKDSRIIIINQENHGAGISRNNGIEIARGKYLSILDGDDFVKLDMLEKAYNKAEQTQAEICVFRCESYDNQTTHTTPMTYTIREFLLPKEEVFSPLEVRKDIFKVFVGWAWDKLFLTEFVKSNDLYFQDLRTTNDLYFVYTALVIATRITVLNDILISHRENINTSLSQTRQQSSECFYFALSELKQFLLCRELYPRFRVDFINYALHFSLWQLDTLSMASKSAIYNNLKTKWFDEFEIDTLTKDEIYRLKEYKLYQAIKSQSFENSRYNNTKSKKNISKFVNRIYIPPKLRQILYYLRDNC